jgi:D-sedoheptulose 7-phosphate isomerase
MTNSKNAAQLEYVRALFDRSILLKQEVAAHHLSVLVDMANACVAALRVGGKIMLCGNGGSAADAQHLAAELLVRLRPAYNRTGIPALALALDSSSMTACGNDFSYQTFYERMVSTLGRRGDILIAITTSGKSPNVVKALDAGRKIGLTTLGFLGGDGGIALPLCDFALVVPSTETGRIQEVHITAGHALMELVEDAALAEGLALAIDADD